MMGSVPVLVWGLAVWAAVALWQDRRTGGRLFGYAETRSVALCHLEPGVVRRVYVTLHDTVLPGQVLVTMDDREERLRLAAIQRDVERLRAEVDAEKARLTADNSRANTDVEDLERRFLWDRETARLEYLSLLTQGAQDRAELRGAQVEFEILESLYATDHSNLREYNEIETTVNSLATQIEGNQRQIAQAKSRFEVADRQWFLFSQRDACSIGFDPVLTPLRFAADVRQKELEDVEQRIDAHVIRSPIAGQVTSLFADAGDRLRAGDPLLTVSVTATNRVLTYLPEADAFVAQQGAEVSVRRLALPRGLQHEYPGVIVTVSAIMQEMPRRNRTMPTLPSWGRAIVIALDESVHLTPGEPVSIILPSLQEGGALRGEARRSRVRSLHARVHDPS